MFGQAEGRELRWRWSFANLQRRQVEVGRWNRAALGAGGWRWQVCDCTGRPLRRVFRLAVWALFLRFLQVGNLLLIHHIHEHKMNDAPAKKGGKTKGGSKK